MLGGCLGGAWGVLGGAWGVLGVEQQRLISSLRTDTQTHTHISLQFVELLLSQLKNKKYILNPQSINYTFHKVILFQG